jgi:putative N6-adenine-specific DNA methylase
MVYLDTSGETLSKHGYRKSPVLAPLQENLACALILATKWKRDTNFINPMCGSGTLAIEAALLATNRPPGLMRSNYGFMHLKGFDEALYQQIRAEAKRNVKKELPFTIIATDKDRKAIEAAKSNAQTAGVDQHIQFEVCKVEDTYIPEDSKGVVMINPPYGERLGEGEALIPLYKQMGDFLKQKCKGYTGYIFTGNVDLAKQIGLRSSRKIPFFNARIECRLLEFELYEGSKKKKSE